MVLSGVCWGVYSLLGQKSQSSIASAPIVVTAINFIWTLPMVVLLMFWQGSSLSFSTIGLLLAITSGALTSALGYVIWYTVVPRLTPSQAAVLQLLVPILAALGGVIWSSELITVPLLVAGFLVFVGVLISRKKVK